MAVVLSFEPFEYIDSVTIARAARYGSFKN